MNMNSCNRSSLNGPSVNWQPINPLTNLDNDELRDLDMALQSYLSSIQYLDTVSISSFLEPVEPEEYEHILSDRPAGTTPHSGIPENTSTDGTIEPPSEDAIKLAFIHHPRLKAAYAKTFIQITTSLRRFTSYHDSIAEIVYNHAPHAWSIATGSYCGVTDDERTPGARPPPPETWFDKVKAISRQITHKVEVLARYVEEEGEKRTIRKKQDIEQYVRNWKPDPGRQKEEERMVARATLDELMARADREHEAYLLKKGKRDAMKEIKKKEEDAEGEVRMGGDVEMGGLL